MWLNGESFSSDEENEIDPLEFEMTLTFHQEVSLLHR